MVKKDTERNHAPLSLGLDYRCYCSPRKISADLRPWIIFLIALPQGIGGGIGLGWYFTHNAPAHQQPTAFGGSANESAAPVSSTIKANAAPGGSTIMHVSPTHTVARRVAQARITPVPGFTAAHKRRNH